MVGKGGYQFFGEFNLLSFSVGNKVDASFFTQADGIHAGDNAVDHLGKVFGKKEVTEFIEVGDEFVCNLSAFILRTNNAGGVRGAEDFSSLFV